MYVYGQLFLIFLLISVDKVKHKDSKDVYSVPQELNFFLM